MTKPRVGYWGVGRREVFWVMREVVGGPVTRRGYRLVGGLGEGLVGQGVGLSGINEVPGDVFGRKLVSRGNLKQVGIYLFFMINNLLVNLLGIPVGTLRGLDSDGR